VIKLSAHGVKEVLVERGRWGLKDTDFEFGFLL
jgi:hypothetical protein